MTRPTPPNARPVIAIGDLFDRLPPHALEAEMSLLGCLILDTRCMADVIGLVPSSTAFYRQSHAAIFEALAHLYEHRNAGDIVQLVQLLRDRGLLDDIGGEAYLVELAGCVPSTVNAVHYARIVADKARLRALIAAAATTIHEAYHAPDLADDDGVRRVLDQAEQRIFELAASDQRSDPSALADLLAGAMDALRDAESGTITGLATGFHDLDEMLCGLQPGELVIVAARPSMGKTALALNIAEQVALRGGRGGDRAPVAFFSMEMSRQSIAQRLLCAASGVDSHRFRRNTLSAADMRALAVACDALSAAPILIDDTPGLTVMQLRAKARRMVAQHGAACIVIDYLQLMSAPGSARDGRQNEVSAISRGVKAIARELNVPVVCLSQLNRGSEQREGHRPRMADLRESGAIEQDADAVILLHREEYYHTQDPDWAMENPDKVGVAELIVAKQRNGPTGVVELAWLPASTRFASLARAVGGHRP